MHARQREVREALRGLGIEGQRLCGDEGQRNGEDRAEHRAHCSSKTTDTVKVSSCTPASTGTASDSCDTIL